MDKVLLATLRFPSQMASNVKAFPWHDIDLSLYIHFLFVHHIIAVKNLPDFLCWLNEHINWSLIR